MIFRDFGPKHYWLLPCPYARLFWLPGEGWIIEIGVAFLKKLIMQRIRLTSRTSRPQKDAAA